MPLSGWHAASVPGAPHAYLTIHREHATLPLGDLWGPAIRYARHGIAASPKISRSIAGAADKLAGFPASAAVYLPGGQPPQPGQPWRNPDLADTIEAVVAGRRRAFYRGDIAGEIVRAAEAERRPLRLRRLRRPRDRACTSRCAPTTAASTSTRPRRPRRG